MGQDGAAGSDVVFAEDSGTPEPDSGAFGDLDASGTGLERLAPDAAAPDAAAADAAAPDAAAPDAAAADAAVPPSDPFDAVEITRRIATEICGYEYRCQPALNEVYPRTPAECEADIGLIGAALYGAAEQAIAVGRASFSQAVFDRCVAKIAWVGCQTDIADFYCQDAFTGHQTLSEPGATTTECSTGYACARGVNQCGRCVARAGIGQSCASMACVEGSTCTREYGPPTCVAQRIESETCGTAALGVCQGQLHCIGGLCSRAAGRGQACAQGSMTERDCDLSASDSCVGGICTEVSWSPPGGPCGSVTGCNGNGYCDATARVCQALPVSGQPCASDGSCAWKSYCDGANCRPVGGAGASCTGAGQCLQHLVCSAGRCTELTWQYCP